MNKSDQKFTKMMTLAVAALGLVSTALLLTDPPTPADTESLADLGPSVFEMNSSKMRQLASKQLGEASSRGIASIDPMTSINLSLIDITCDSSMAPIETTQIRLRLKGQNCIHEKTLSTTIKNNSNGYIATVFHKPDFSFTTDYINLSEGENEIALSFETTSGTISRKIKINRSPASATMPTPGSLIESRN